MLIRLKPVATKCVVRNADLEENPIKIEIRQNLTAICTPSTKNDTKRRFLFDYEAVCWLILPCNIADTNTSKYESSFFVIRDAICNDPFISL